jgi:hypothetical protein
VVPARVPGYCRTVFALGQLEDSVTYFTVQYCTVGLGCFYILYRTYLYHIMMSCRSATLTKPAKSYEPKELDTLGSSYDTCQWYSRGVSFQLKLAEIDDDCMRCVGYESFYRFTAKGLY